MNKQHLVPAVMQTLYLLSVKDYTYYIRKENSFVTYGIYVRITGT